MPSLPLINSEPSIRIRGARTHNLRSIDLDLPRQRLIVFTGPSGSGKSSLAFDTLYAEGQRRYVESVSLYARQVLGILEKPDVDGIDGLSPAIAISQQGGTTSSRSTVATLTQIYDYLRLLFARVGIPQCPEHGIELQAWTISQMVDQVLALPEGTRIMLLAPLQGAIANWSDLLDNLRRQGFVRARIEGAIIELDTPPTLSHSSAPTIEVVVDRCKVRPDQALRLAESFATALQWGEGQVKVALMDGSQPDWLLTSRFACPVCDYHVAPLEPALFSFNTPRGACPTCKGLPSEPVCPDCQGSRLNRTARHVMVAGVNLPAVNALTVNEAQHWCQHLTLPGWRGEITARLVAEIMPRLGFLTAMGLGYLNLGRSADTLSGGELQRIRLASQIGASLAGVLYVLDEPSIGLHQRDNARLLAMLHRLRDLGNTVIVVEHDADTIRAADYVVDIGPGAGTQGGRITAVGTPAEITANPASLTGQYLSAQRCIPLPKRRLKPKRWLHIRKASGHNLRDIDAAIPLGVLTCVTGVSGSGKSTLINTTLYRYIARELNGTTALPAPCQAVEGLDQIDKIITIDQRPIGRTPRSNPATYTGLFEPIRELFAATPEARSRGYTPGRFSFNVKGGRCEACQGDGVIKVAMPFMPDADVPCDVCHGQRFNRETLQVTYKGCSIADILALSVEQAQGYFKSVPAINQRLQTLIAVGLGYLSLGQSATTLSGGEAQRVKLARELARRDTGNTLYILDEPTTGLHFQDIEQLLQVLWLLRDRGNTLVIIEHHLDVIKTADWIIDLGPEGGQAGGDIIATGTPEQVAACPHSHTGQFLRPMLLNSKHL